MKLAFIIPRYHVPQAGGAEILVENLAQRLAAGGHTIEVLTTGAVDHTQWGNDLPLGPQTVQGVRVHRFRVDSKTNLTRFAQLQQRLDRGWPLNLREEEVWISGSVHSQDLYQALRERNSEWDALIFAPYLFGLTYQGLQIAPEKSFLIPCLHPEPYAYLKTFKKMFQQPRRILFNSFPEKELGKSLFGLSEERCAVVGMGFEPLDDLESDSFRGKFRMGASPFILYTGRREKGKNTPLLIDYFSTYKKHHACDLKLVLLGSGKLPVDLKKSGDILDLGFLSREDMLSAYREAAVTCQPSVNESFAIVLMESWLSSTPVLVNAKCEVTRDHVQRSSGGLWFKNYFEFEECLNFFLSRKEVNREMAQRGKRYVLDHFKWEDVLGRFLKAVSF